MERIDPVLVEVPMPIRTPRLLIRAWQPGDGLQLLEAERESWTELKRWDSCASGPADELTERSEEALVRRRAAEFILRTEIRLPAFSRDGRLLGVGGYHAIDWHGRIFNASYWIRTSETGKGLATELLNALIRYAFGALAANRLGVSYVIGNDGSRRVIEKSGFEKEGTTPKYRVLNGVLIDAHHYARFGCEGLQNLDVSWG